MSYQMPPIVQQLIEQKAREAAAWRNAAAAFPRTSNEAEARLDSAQRAEEFAHGLQAKFDRIAEIWSTVTPAREQDGRAR